MKGKNVFAVTNAPLALLKYIIHNKVVACVKSYNY
jgi:hypothetical protein